ncbi:mandelate racemase/muconate lactonizing enzyme family protein [Chloroflexi bacterium TSY]|nr:mandelate racemase/muconate lactonizing enzyme family protein [Chloroflexi bacterium TSY]
MIINLIEPIVVHVNHRGDWIFVLVHTDTEITGLGEASHSGNDALLLSVLESFAQRLIGRDPRQIEAIWHELARVNGGRIAYTALSAIEQALWDILGQHLDAPIHTLFGGEMRQRLRLYANINRHVRNRTPEGFARAAQQAVVEGFTAIKIAPFDELQAPNHVRTGPQAAWQNGVARVRAVRAAIGDEIELAIDCHSRMEPSEAIAVGQELIDCNLFWYEEPVHHRHPDGLRRVGEALPMPIASAESVFGLEGFRPFLTERIVDVLMPDVKHDGGLLETKQIAAAARMHQVLVAPHQPAGPVASAATAQVVSTIPNFYILEYAWGEADWRADLLTPAERIEDGHLILPAGPGLGHQLNWDVVEAHRIEKAKNVDSSKVQPKKP